MARRQVQVNGPATAIADQMPLRIQPAFGLAGAPPARGVFFTPFAAIRCVLIWRASIISVDRPAFFMRQSRENPLKNACRAPAFPAIAKRFGRAIPLMAHPAGDSLAGCRK